MKRCYYFFLSVVGLVGLGLISGCGDNCKKVSCPEDVDFPPYMELQIPYQVGQIVRFANEDGDNIVLTCEKRLYTDQPLGLDLNQQDCCKSAFAKNISCSLKSSNNDKLSIFTTFPGNFHVAMYGALLGGVQFQEDTYYWSKIDSIELNDKIFNNVFIVGDDPDFIMYNSLDGLGVVGFNINGVEWALIE